MVENAVYVWAGGANGEEISVFENIRIRVDGASGVRLLLELYCVIVVKHVAFFAVLCHINNGSDIDQFTFELLPLCFPMCLWFQI